MANVLEARHASISDASVDSSPLLASSGQSENVDSSPLLASSGQSENDSDVYERPSTAPRGAISRVFSLIRQRSAGRLVREPSIVVRETAAEEFEERQSEWAYSKPIVILDLTWNLIFAMVAGVMLLMSIKERPTNPLRIWVLGYAAQCCIHVACVWFEYRRRHSNGGNRHDSETPSYTSNEDDCYPDRYQIDRNSDPDFDDPVASQISVAKQIESANTSFSFVWWVLGFYWSSTGNQSQSAPLLFWLCAAFLAFDIFFVAICVILACIIGVALCCCLPCIIAIMYAVAEPEGASEQDINMLPKYKFQCIGKSFTKPCGGVPRPIGGVLTILGNTAGAVDKRILPAEDMECCICLSSYIDGDEIRELHCRHLFHCACVDRWLRMNSACPLCKLSIVQDSQVRRGQT